MARRPNNATAIPRPTPAPALTRDPLDALHGVAADIAAHTLEREDAILALMLGLTARRNVFLFGPPGTAKSRTVSALAARVTGARSFDALMSAFTLPEDVFGPLDIAALEAGRNERRIDGYLPTADIAFLDEVFKAGPGILNTLLRVVNERSYKHGSATIACPLAFAVGASNELPQDSSLAALYDRFPVRVAVDYVAEESSIRALLATSRTPAVGASVTLPELHAAHAACDAVQLDATTEDAIIAIRAALAGEGMRMSDRTLAESTALIRAHAYWYGRAVTTPEDAGVLRMVAWARPEERRKAALVVLSVAAPATGKATELRDLAHEQLIAFRTARDGATRIDAVEKLRKLGEECAALARVNPANPDIRAYETAISAWRLDVMRAMTGIRAPGAK